MIYGTIILPVLKKSIEPTVPVPAKLPANKKMVKNITSRREKRKRKSDRRQSARDGIIVSLSFAKDRRKRKRRRVV